MKELIDYEAIESACKKLETTEDKKQNRIRALNSRVAILNWISIYERENKMPISTALTQTTYCQQINLPIKQSKSCYRKP